MRAKPFSIGIVEKVRYAKFKINGCIEDIDYGAHRGLKKSMILQLASCDWIRHAHNIIITGPTRVGKNYLACALANRACRMSYAAFYIRMLKLFQDLGLAKADGSYPKIMKNLTKSHLALQSGTCNRSSSE